MRSWRRAGLRSRKSLKAGRGFTLLEVLVMLVVTSLISVVLMQGMGLILNLRDNLGDQMVDLDRTVLKRGMVRQPIQGLTPDFDGEAYVFNGQPDSIIGLTTQPLVRRSGRTIPFMMKLEYDAQERLNRLIYREDQDGPLILAEWEGDQAVFRYIGDETGWSETWPKPDSAFAPSNVITEARPPQLPEVIYLDTRSEREMDYGMLVQTRRNRIPRDPVF